MLERLTIVTCYYSQPAMLDEQIRTIESYPGDIAQRLKLIVIDDGSPEPAKVPATLACEVELYRILEDRPWHLVGSRNLGMHVAPEGWCLMIDIDHTVPTESMEWLLASDLDDCCYYLPGHRVMAHRWAPHHPHPDSRVITRKMYWDAGGSNEKLAGIYGAGNEFPARLRAKYGPGVTLPIALMVYNLAGVDLDPDVPGAGAPLPRKRSEFHWKTNPKLGRIMRAEHGKMPTSWLNFEWMRVL